MGFLLEECSFESLHNCDLSEKEKFDCGHDDLNDFFNNDCVRYSEQLLGRTYCFTLQTDPKKIVCAFTVSNDSIKVNDLPNSRKKKINKDIPRQKMFKSYPAVLIGRLGVSVEFGNKGIGSDLMNFIKSWFVSLENKTGCRFIVVDAYNEEIPIRYYEKNGFATIFSTEEQEKEYFGINLEEKIRTRLMFFDLITLGS